VGSRLLPARSEALAMWKKTPLYVAVTMLATAVVAGCIAPNELETALDTEALHLLATPHGDDHDHHLAGAHDAAWNLEVLDYTAGLDKPNTYGEIDAQGDLCARSKVPPFFACVRVPLRSGLKQPPLRAPHRREVEMSRLNKGFRSRVKLALDEWLPFNGNETAWIVMIVGGALLVSFLMGR
jgi:hypothetical protein